MKICKCIWICLILCFLFHTLCFAQSATVQTLIYEDFEGENHIKISDESGASKGKTEVVNKYGINYTFISPSKDTVQLEDFEKTYMLSDAEGYDIEANTYVETQFDIIPLSGKEAGVALYCDKSTDGTYLSQIKFNSQGKIVLRCRDGKRSNGTITDLPLCDFTYNTPYRISILIHASDSDGNSCEQIVSVKVNGNEMLNSSAYFISYSSGKVGYYNKIRLLNASSMYFDNLKVMRYTSTDEEYSLPDKGKLVFLLRRYNTYFSGLSTDNPFYSVYKSGDTVYNFVQATNEEINEAVRAIEEQKIAQFSVKSITAQGSDGKEGQFLYRNGTLKSVTLARNYNEPFNGKFYMALYDENNVLKNVQMCGTEISEDSNEITITPYMNIPEYMYEGYAKFYLWSDEQISALNKVSLNMADEIPQYSDATVYINGSKYKTDMSPLIRYNGDIMIVTGNIINLLGMELVRDNHKYSCSREDGKTLEWDTQSGIMTIDGTETVEGVCAVYKEHCISELGSICKALGCDYELVVEGEDTAIYITYSYTEPEYPSYEEDGIQVEFIKNTPYDIGFKIPYSNSDAKVEVWLRLNDPSLLNLSGYDVKPQTTASNWSGGYKQCLDNALIHYWKKAYTPYYDGESFCSSMGDLVNGWRYYDMKIAITDNGKTKTYVKKKAFATKAGYSYPTLSDYVYQTGGELMLVPTFENIGYYIDNTENATSCSIYYKSNAEEEWKTAYKPYYDSTANQWRGSIVGLSENTQYYVKAVMSTDNDSIEKTANTFTWQDSPMIGRTINANELIDNGMLNIQGIKGTPDSWVKITGNGQTVIDGGFNNTEAVYISDCRYVIVENLKVRGGKRTGVLICNGSSDVRIQNCDISDWGRRGVFDSYLGEYVADGGSVNYEAGIRMRDCSNIVVERCYIHDSRTQTNPWVGDTWDWIHPKGSCGIYYQTKDACVIRYNDIIGCDDYRYNDAIEGAHNGARYGGPNKNTDIYGNMLFGTEDDGVEIDGGQMNVRVYNNRIEQSLCGISTAPNLAGPSYIFRNLITNMGTSNDRYIGTAIKTGGSKDEPNGIMYLFNNTIDSISHAVRNVGYTSGEYHCVSRNNIFVTRTDGNDAFTNTWADERDDNNYDMIWGRVRLKEGDGLQNITQLPEYEDYDKGLYSLKLSDSGVDGGLRLDNFTEEYSGESPDIGALENGNKKVFLPFRPVDISSDRYMVRLNENESCASITITAGEQMQQQAYSILKNGNCEWLSITDTNTENIIGKNSRITFTVNADISKCNTVSQNAVVLFRLDDGYSIPISIKLTK